jgi:hypothetical protein
MESRSPDGHVPGFRCQAKGEAARPFAAFAPGLMGEQAHRFTVGPGLVHGGYDGDDSDWLRGGAGYPVRSRSVV